MQANARAPLGMDIYCININTDLHVSSTTLWENVSSLVTNNNNKRVGFRR